jgi:hypothetical protein
VVVENTSQKARARRYSNICEDVVSVVEFISCSHYPFG